MQQRRPDSTADGYRFFLSCLALAALTVRPFHGERRALSVALASLVGICVYNGNAWALVAIPLVWAFGDSRIEVPRWRWLFLGYYVGHLAVLATISGGMDVGQRILECSQ